ncbi:class I SAM-dependent methyltransferase [Variovorax sp. J31P207]|uniref:FkbM family methyltransferase n=1 Tax=Variovorax sp. J31P207 TaxID=3053510 RepID=UPI002575D9FD|nr:class I SAM-dependent methyltransferase [Variovorax sp. J31P207]MDM0067679.1 class I SAM-dependent methyltransferase [Variovorax sp. J31P207]
MTNSDFDLDWYVTTYPDVLSFAAGPQEHYRLYGNAEGRHPTKSAYEAALGFDRNWYLTAYPDVAEAGGDPFEHYLSYGKKEGRHSNQYFSFFPGHLEVLKKSYHCPPDPLRAEPAGQSFDSAKYWSDRYRTGGNSGAGSYGRLAQFKAETINSFVRENGIDSVIEFGCGDGAQLALADYPSYLGFDVTDASIELCKSKFGQDTTKNFLSSSAYDFERADLVLSLDVIFHLIEDEVFHEYMQRLFASADRYVIIYSSNMNSDWPASHVKHRKFSDWIEIYHADFERVGYVPNPYPLHGDPQNESFADFYIYRKRPRHKHSLPGQLLVSVTSYPKRFNTLELTLRRILQQSVQADETILWVAQEDRDQIPQGVLALQRSGLSIRVTEDLRSYKKIIPALKASPASFILTLDDDTAYPLDVIEPLVANYRRSDEILCRRAHRVAFDENGEVLPYKRWQFQTEVEESSPNLFPTGVGGILYPPGSLHPDVLDQATFTALAPLADDVWLYWMEWLAGSTVRRVGPAYLVQPWPGCDEQGLWTSHNSAGGNDKAILGLGARYGSPFGVDHALPKLPELHTHSPLRSMFKRFAWSIPSAARNELTCQYEPFQPFFFLKLVALARSRIIFDVGANIGAYSILASQVPTIETIHAFEIEEAAYQQLEFNVYANRLEGRVLPHFLAVSNKDGEVVFGVARPMAGNNGVIETSFHSQDIYSEQRRVRCVALDSLLSYADEQIALKIDIEGHELQALQGCKRILSNNRCMAQVEIYEKDQGIKSFLEEIGYKLMFTAGPDHYFSNIEDFSDPKIVLSAVESSLADLLKCSLRA